MHDHRPLLPIKPASNHHEAVGHPGSRVSYSVAVVSCSWGVMGKDAWDPLHPAGSPYRPDSKADDTLHSWPRISGAGERGPVGAAGPRPTLAPASGARSSCKSCFVLIIRHVIGPLIVVVTEMRLVSLVWCKWSAGVRYKFKLRSAVQCVHQWIPLESAELSSM